MKLTRLIGILFLVPIMILGGCTSSEKENLPKEKTTLTIGIMPAVDIAPIYLAEEKGYFDELGLDLDIQLFNNAQDRQTALQTQTIDGALTDLIAVATNVDSGFGLKATTLTDGVFPILVKKGYEEKSDVKVAMMEVSVTNFLIDEWLGDKFTIEKIFINDIPSRLEMIKNGQADMGLFPEPLASNGATGGLEKRIYTPEDGICPNVMAFTTKALQEKEEAIVLFHEGYNKAVSDLIENPEEARTLLIDKLALNPEIKESIILPTYTMAHLPKEAYLQKIIDWVKSDLKAEIKVTPNELTDERFVK